jgi:hypothetical protein
VQAARPLPGADGNGLAWPLYFEPIPGQSDDSFEFRVRGVGFPLAVTGSRTVARVPTESGTTILVTELVGASAAQPAITEAPLAGKVHYLRPSPADSWADIPTFARLRYPQVYPHTDLLLRGAEGRLEYDFELAVGGDPARIVMDFKGARELSLDEHGDLLINLDGTTLRHHRPVAWQPTAAGSNEPVEASFRLLPNERVGFTLATYDPGRPLVIDPVVTFSSYLGGGSDQIAEAIAVDGDGMVYITGTTGSDDFPVTAGALDLTFNGGGATIGDVFVAKLDPTSGALVYATYVGGSDGDRGYAIAVDASGAAYVAGKSFSENFPTTAGAFDTTIGAGGAADVIVFKLNPAGSALVYSTWLEAGIPDGRGIAVDGAGNAYVSGRTGSGFPTVNPIMGWQGGFDLFVSKLNATGSALIYSTYIGGSGDESTIQDVPLTLDGQGSVYVAGTTTSDDLPVTPGAAQTNRGGGRDAFLVKLNPAGSAIVYATYLGGTGDDEALGVGVDAFRRVILVGETRSSDFPLANPFQSTFGGTADGFIARFSPGGGLSFSSYLGVNLADSLEAVSVLANGDFYVVGDFLSSSIELRAPLPLQYQPSQIFGVRNYLAKLTGNPPRIQYSTFVGGTGGVGLSGVVSDGQGNAYLVGTVADNLPIVNPVQSQANGFRDSFVSVVRDPARAGIGLYGPAQGRFLLLNTLSSGQAAEINTRYLQAPSTRQAIVGDWDGDGIATPGLYDAIAGRFLLRNSATQGFPHVNFRFGPFNSSWLPVVGDWDGDGEDSVGLYDRVAGRFVLAENPTQGTPVLRFRFGRQNVAWFPIAADWNASGRDGIGLYDPVGGRFYLRFEPTAGASNRVIRFGPTGLRPLVGDWDGDGAAGIGLYNPAAGRYLLRNELSSGAADFNVRFGPANAGWTPLAGNWDGR